MKTPTHLDHKPILAVHDYNEKDGGNPRDETDAKALSIGKAQWNNNEISAKIFRRPKNRWSRQSEEMPLHRVLDLANLVLSAYLQKSGDYKQSTILKEEILDVEGFELIKKHIKDNHYLEERIRELKKTLNKL